MTEQTQRYTRIRINGTQLAKGQLQPDITVEMVDPGLLDSALAADSIDLWFKLMHDWREKAEAEGYTLIPKQEEPK